MTFAIIGSGAIGSALAYHFARTGIDVFLANSRGPSSLTELTQRLGKAVKASTVKEAAKADIVILAVPFTAVTEVVAGTDWKGRIVVDATNAIEFPSFKPKDLRGRLSTDIVADAVKGAQVVKAFNTVPAPQLAMDPSQHGGRRVIFLSGNSPEANAQVKNLIEKLGFAAIDLGKISEGGRAQQFGGSLGSLNLTKH